MANFFYRFLMFLHESFWLIYALGRLKFLLIFSPEKFDKTIRERGKRSGMNLSKLDPDDYGETLTYWSTIWHEICVLWEEFIHERKAYKGYPAPDVPVILFQKDEKQPYEEIQLLKKFARPGVPLVLNFGSCT